MRFAAILALCTAACAASGPPVVETPISTTPVEPLPDVRTREDPWALFTSTVLDAGRALDAAVRGNAYDPKWQCADPKKDIRSTEAGALATYTSLGNPEFLLSMLEGITLSAPPGSSEPDPPAEEESAAPRKPARLTITGTAMVFADGRLRWFQLSNRRSYDDTPSIRIKQMPETIRGAMSELVSTLSSRSCALPFLDETDVRSLPIPASRKDSAVETLEHEAAELHHVCELVARSSGPWEARLGRINAVSHVGEQIAVITADMKIEDGKLCIGRAKAFVQ